MVEGVGEVSMPVSSQSKEVSSQPKEVSSPKSYATAVGSRPSLAKFDVKVSMVDGKAMVAVPDEVLNDTVPLWEDFLIGRFPSTAPHVAKIHVIVNKIWNLGDKSIRIDVFVVNSTTVKFRIRNGSARMRALRRGMWNICEQPMMMSKWTPIVEDAQPEIKTMPLWVKIKNVPHSMFTWPGLSFLASPVGDPKRLHPDTELVSSFEEAKVFVEADLSKELPKTYFFQIRGEEVRVEFDYPWLPQRCGICQKWGHPDDSCLASTGRVGSPCVQSPQGILPEPQPVAVNVASKVTETVISSEINSESSLTSAYVEEKPCEKETLEEKDSVSVETEQSVSPGIHQADQSNDGEWQNAPQSGRKISTNSGQKLVYGQVRIISPTRFDALRDKPEEGEFIPEVNSDQKAPVPRVQENKVEDELVTAQKNQLNRDTGALRVQLPRDSKNSHKFLSENSQRARDTVSSNFRKKNSKPKH